MRPHASTRHLGEYLVAIGALTAEQLDEGAQSQAVYGARLGTNLVELGYLSVDELAKHLTNLTGVGPPPPEWLESPDPEALKLVPRLLVERHGILPLALEGKTLHVAMLDPRDPVKREEIAQAAGRRVRAHLLPELRLLYFMEIHLGVARDVRFVGPEETGDGSIVPSQDPQLLGPSEVASLEASLTRPVNREGIARDALQIARAHASAVALFHVQRDMILGSSAAGGGLEERIGAVLLPSDEESVLSRALTSGKPVRGSAPHSGIDALLFELLGRADACEVAVFPVKLRGRVVSLLYADNGRGPLGETSLAALEALSACLSRAYERLILQTKRRSD